MVGFYVQAISSIHRCVTHCGTFLSSVGMQIHQSEATSGAKTACPDTYLTDLLERCLGSNNGRIFEHDWNWLTVSCLDYWSLGIFFLFEAWNSRFCSTGTSLSSVGMQIHQSEATSGAKTACPDTYLTDLRERCLDKNKCSISSKLGAHGRVLCTSDPIYSQMRETLWHVLVFSWYANSPIWSYLRSQDCLPWYLPDWPSGKMFGLKQGQNIWTWLKLIDCILPGLLVSWHFLSLWSLK